MLKPIVEPDVERGLRYVPNDSPNVIRLSPEQISSLRDGGQISFIFGDSHPTKGISLEHNKRNMTAMTQQRDLGGQDDQQEDEAHENTPRDEMLSEMKKTLSFIYTSVIDINSNISGKSIVKIKFDDGFIRLSGSDADKNLILSGRVHENCKILFVRNKIIKQIGKKSKKKSASRVFSRTKYQLNDDGSFTCLNNKKLSLGLLSPGIWTQSYRRLDATDIEGTWFCCYFPFVIGFKKRNASGVDVLNEDNCCCIPICPCPPAKYSEEYIRLANTNIFVNGKGNPETYQCDYCQIGPHVCIIHFKLCCCKSHHPSVGSDNSATTSIVNGPIVSNSSYGSDNSSNFGGSASDPFGSNSNYGRVSSNYGNSSSNYGGSRSVAPIGILESTILNTGSPFANR